MPRCRSSRTWSQPAAYFDAYVVVGQPRDLLYPGAAGTRALTPSGQAGNYPVLLVDGVVGGVWHTSDPARGSPSPSSPSSG